VQWLLVALYLAAIVLILLLPSTAGTLVPSFARAAHDYFANVAPALSRLFGIPGFSLDNRLVALLAFILHLSLPQLVHQSRGDPLDRHLT
jgi:hypothetical protein